MGVNWLDAILIIILLITIILGLVKGLIRQIIGIVAVVAGLVLGILYYPLVSEFYSQFISHEVASHFLGFFTIFLLVLCLGWLISFLLSKLTKGPLKFMNHVLGGIFGLLKGILICGVVVFALLLFPINKKALKESLLAPYCVYVTKAAVGLIPQELKEKFKEAYQEITRGVEKNGKEV